MIYELTLVKDESIDLWPASHWGTFEPGGQGRARDHGGKDARFAEVMRTIREGLEVNLLRTCKRISSEASPILYGRNDFRFTMEDGWFPLYRFLVTIGEWKRSYIKSVSVFVPIESLFYEERTWMPRPLHFDTPALESRFTPADVTMSVTDAVRGCCELWMREKSLRTLYLVAPPGMHLDRNAFQLGFFEDFKPLIKARDELSLEMKLVFYYHAGIGLYGRIREYREAIVQVKKELGWETLVWFDDDEKYQVAVFEDAEDPE